MRAAFASVDLSSLLGQPLRTIYRRAQREGWRSLPRKARGGGKLWLVESMPEATRARLLPQSSIYKDRGAGRARLRGGKVAVIGGRDNGRKGLGVLDANPEANKLLLGLLKDKPHARARYFFEALRLRFPTLKISLRRVQDWLRRWKAANPSLYLSLTNADRWRSQHQAAIGDATAAVSRANQVWEMDSTPWDVLTRDGKRHAIVGLIDVFTRRVRLLSVRTSTARAVGAVLRRAILDLGLPETVKTDNGQDYVAGYTQRVFTGLGIIQEVCPPFSPWKKPFIERFFHTFSHDLLEVMGGYVGHNVAEREALRARQPFSARLGKGSRDVNLETAMTADELQKFLDDWTLRYEHRPHSGLAGKTPWQVYQDALARGEIRRLPESRLRELDGLLLPLAPGRGGLRTVTAKGVRAGVPGRYWHEVLAVHIGRQVQVRLDDSDLSRAIIHDIDGNFLCEALNVEMHGITEADAKRAKNLQRAALREQRRAMARAAEDMEVAAIPLQILARDVAEARAIKAASPAGVEPGAESRPKTPGRRVAVTEWQAPAGDAARYAECLRIVALETAGGEEWAAVPERARNWARAWGHSPTFQAFEMLRQAGARQKAVKEA